MLLFIQCVIACLLFTALIYMELYKNPLKQIMSYPPAIRKRIESLPQYKDIIAVEKKEHISKKTAAVFVFAIILALTAYYSGAKSFEGAFWHSFIIFTAINIYDLLVLDIGIFCHSKKLRIPGTEDMDKEYKDYLFHFKASLMGTIIGGFISLLAAFLVHLAGKL